MPSIRSLPMSVAQHSSPGTAEAKKLVSSTMSARDAMQGNGDSWAAGDAYEVYMGRWSHLVAREFLAWLRVDPGQHWLEVGCGSGALTAAIQSICAPASIVACDQSAAFVEHARARLADARIAFVTS